MTDGIFEIYVGVLIILGGLLAFVLVSRGAYAVSLMCIMIGLIVVGVGWTNVQSYRTTKECPQCGHLFSINLFHCPECGDGPSVGHEPA